MGSNRQSIHLYGSPLVVSDVVLYMHTTGLTRNASVRVKKKRKENKPQDSILGSSYTKNRVKSFSTFGAAVFPALRPQLCFQSNPNLTNPNGESYTSYWTKQFLFADAHVKWLPRIPNWTLHISNSERTFDAIVQCLLVWFYSNVNQIYKGCLSRCLTKHFYDECASQIQCRHWVQ